VWGLSDGVVAAATPSPLIPASGAGASATVRYRMPHVGFRAPVVGCLAARAGLRMAGARGATAHATMIEDYEVCRRPWGFDLGQVGVPVSVWHGRQDRLVPATHALRMAAALPACSTHLEPRGGHFFFKHRAAEIIESVLERAQAA
jgi:pimeloyl-ACP methyl ester carboxylesterase